MFYSYLLLILILFIALFFLIYCFYLLFLFNVCFYILIFNFFFCYLFIVCYLFIFKIHLLIVFISLLLIFNISKVKLLHRNEVQGTTPFPGFTLDTYLIMQSVKQRDIKYHFLSMIFGMTRTGIEQRSLPISYMFVFNLFIVYLFIDSLL